MEFFITYCFLPFAIIPLLIQTAGCYTLPYSIHFCEHDTDNYYDYAASTPVKSCSTSRSDRQGYHGNQNHIWLSRAYT